MTQPRIQENGIKHLKESNQYIQSFGCGKGSFISQLALKNQNVNYVAIDLVDAMLGLAKRNIEQLYSEKEITPENVYLTRYDIERIFNVFDEKDEIERIYINFCIFNSSFYIFSSSIYIYITNSI